MRKLFGTDGVRGTANVHPMTVEMATQLGRAAAYVFKQDDSRRHQILIGKDTRLSGYMFENALTAGICSMGVDVIVVGPLPTPGVAYITRSLRADAGIVISASHNPYEDNGIKFFAPDGFKLPDEKEMEIEALISSGKLNEIRPNAHEIGKSTRIDDAVGRYIEFVKATFPKGLTLDGMKIVVDVANGACYKAAPRALMELGAKVITINDEPDGMNINATCGSLYPEEMQARVIKDKADLGAAFDGDGDRVILADENGQLRDGDIMMTIAALDMQQRGLLNGNTIVNTPMSNVGMDLALKRSGVKVVKSKVGDRYVVEKMLEGNYNIGGEKSGHIVFLDYNTTGDATITLLQILSVMRTTGRTLGELSHGIEMFPQVLKNVVVGEKPPLEQVKPLYEAIEQARKELGEDSQVVVRYSGTEPKLRIMIQGREKQHIEQLAQNLVQLAQSELGA